MSREVGEGSSQLVLQCFEGLYPVAVVPSPLSFSIQAFEFSPACRMHPALSSSARFPLQSGKCSADRRKEGSV